MEFELCEGARHICAGGRRVVLVMIVSEMEDADVRAVGGEGGIHGLRWIECIFVVGGF